MSTLTFPSLKFENSRQQEIGLKALSYLLLDQQRNSDVPAAFAFVCQHIEQVLVSDLGVLLNRVCYGMSIGSGVVMLSAAHQHLTHWERASILLHEAHHECFELLHRGRKYPAFDRTEELLCLQAQRDFLTRNDQPLAWVNSLIVDFYMTNH